MTNTPQAKLDIKLGSLSFSGEGDQDWLTSQLQMLIDCAETLNRDALSQPQGASQAPLKSPNGSQFQEPLATYLKSKNAEKNQNMRFLVTADWLRRRGSETLTSGMVARALLDNHQSRLGNPSDCLNQNVAKGLCEKSNGGFFITQIGMKTLGYE